MFKEATFALGAWRPLRRHRRRLRARVPVRHAEDGSLQHRVRTDCDIVNGVLTHPRLARIVACGIDSTAKVLARRAATLRGRVRAMRSTASPLREDDAASDDAVPLLSSLTPASPLSVGTDTGTGTPKWPCLRAAAEPAPSAAPCGSLASGASTVRSAWWCGWPVSIRLGPTATTMVPAAAHPSR